MRSGAVRQEKPQDPNASFVPREEDDVQIMEGDDIEPCLLYQPDGEKELDREPIFNNEPLGAGVFRCPKALVKALWPQEGMKKVYN